MLDKSILAEIERHLDGQGTMPPIHLWTPALSGDIDIVIKANGDWFHEGDKIQRHKLVKLFASILRREDDGCYYLVTPVEKWRIVVEEAALIVVDMDVLYPQDKRQQLIFTTNVDTKVLLSEQFPLTISYRASSDEPIPEVAVANKLTAKLSRAVFYRLVDIAEIKGDCLSVISSECRFQLGPVNE